MRKSDFRIHTIESAPKASREALAQAKKAFGFVPNLLGGLAEAPAALKAYLAVAGQFESSSLSSVERNVVLLSISFENRCDYCMAAHSTGALAVRMPEATVKALRDGVPLGDHRLEALRRFTRAVVSQRGWVSMEALETFLQAGYTRAQALEVLGGVAQKTLSNYANHLMETPLDGPFEKMAWKVPAEAGARG